MVAVWPAGQVTVPASRSMVNSSLLKYPFGAADGWAGAVSSTPSSARLASILAAAVVGVADHLGHRDGVILEQTRQDLPVAGGRGRGLAGHEQVGVDIDADVQLVAVVAVPAGTMTVAGVGIHRRDHPLRRHPLSNAHPARPVVFDILGGHHRQQLHLGHQSPHR